MMVVKPKIDDKVLLVKTSSLLTFCVANLPPDPEKCFSSISLSEFEKLFKNKFDFFEESFFNFCSSMDVPSAFNDVTI